MDRRKSHCRQDAEGRDQIINPAIDQHEHLTEQVYQTHAESMYFMMPHIGPIEFSTDIHLQDAARECQASYLAFLNRNVIFCTEYTDLFQDFKGRTFPRLLS